MLGYMTQYEFISQFISSEEIKSSLQADHWESSQWMVSRAVSNATKFAEHTETLKIFLLSQERYFDSDGG